MTPSTRAFTIKTKLEKSQKSGESPPRRPSTQFTGVPNKMMMANKCQWIFSKNMSLIAKSVAPTCLASNLISSKATTYWPIFLKPTSL